MDLDNARCYHALLSRDRRFDGRFFTGVLTTGIYCRPICPTRPPQPKNARFFACAAAAEAEGFRPCRRCHPEAAPGTPAWTGTSAIVSRALRLIADHALDEASVDTLAARLGIGERHLRRLFAQHLGASPLEVARARRVHFARTLLDDTRLPVTRIAYAAGFRSLRQFNHAMLATFDQSPRELRRQLPGSVRARTDQPGPGELVVRLPYRPPLDWSSLLGFLAMRATPGVEVVEDGCYRRTVELNGTSGCIEVRHNAEAHQLTMRIDAPGCEGLMVLVERARRLFDVSADPLAIASQLNRASMLRSGLRAGIRVPGAWDPFEVAVRAVLGQQISVKGATTLAGRLAARFGRPVAGYETWGLSRLSPGPADLADADLESAGLPRARAHTIRGLARAVADGTLRLESPHGLDEAVSRLCAMSGLGPWTAQYIAMRALGEPDAFPSSDLGLRKAMGNGSGPASAIELERAAEAWRPWRAYAAICLWTAGRRQTAVGRRQTAVGRQTRN